MADMIATRDAYGKALVEFGAQYDNLVVLDADLAAATKTEMFEQVRNSVGYPGTNVKIGATHGGITVGEDGATHQCLEDFALMRTIPGMTVICPADAGEARLAVQAAIEYNGPVYLRFGRMAVPVLYDNSYAFSIGKGSRLVEGNDVSLIANGVEVEQALVAAELLKADGIHASVVNMATIKPLDQEMVLEEAKRCGCIVTCEEHSVIGGLGAAVCEFLSETMPTPVLRVGTNDCYGRSGSAKVLLSLFGLDAAAICEKAKAAIQMKK